MIAKLQLSHKEYLAKGGEREIYIHPFDTTKVIKIIFSKGKHNNQNKLDYEYFQYLKTKTIDYSHIAKCYDFVETNKGIGLICERIVNFDNSEIRTLSHCAKYRLLDEKILLNLISELKNYLVDNNILFVDASLANVFCQKVKHNTYKLIIFDGLGARRPGIKFWLYLHSSMMTKYKIKKQWKVFIDNYKKEYSLNIKLNP